MPFLYLGLLLGLLWGGVYSLERACLYVPRRVIDVLPRSYGLDYEDVRLKASDGVEIRGWFLPAGAGASPALLFFHGNGGDISDRLDKLRLFHSLGLSVFIFDYRGYGQSAGRPSEQGTYRDGLAAAEHLLGARALPRERLVYYGESLGCAVALETALRRPPAALILDSAFTSTPDMARKIFPRLPLGWLIRNRYDNLAKIGNLKVPALILHSPQDDIVPYEMGRRLFAAAPEPKEFFESRGDHNEGFLGTPGYGAAIGGFIKRTVK